MLLAGLLLVLATIPFLQPVRAVTRKVLDVGFPNAPDTSMNVVNDNFLGISWELFPVNYLCESKFTFNICL